MEFKKVAQRRNARRVNHVDISSEYVTESEVSSQCKVQFYSIPPTQNISLQEFEDYAVQRLKVLKVVENVGLKNKGTQDYNSVLENQLVDLGIWKSLFSVTKSGVIEDLRKDHISHFTLRLAYCKSDELRRWLLQHEVDLFKFRFSRMDDVLQQQFCTTNGIDLTEVTAAEKKELCFELAACTARVGHDSVQQLNFYKVPWTEVVDLVRLRRCFLRGGYAYVSQEDVASLVVGSFRIKLSEALAHTARALPRLQEEDRLLPLLSSLTVRYLGEDFSSNKRKEGSVTPEMLDQLSKESYPLCMSQLHQALRRNHHLRYFGRLQYGLFLKGIGLSLDDALRFWRSEFIRVMDADKFDKQYAYNIRYNYGKEGKRTDFSPFSCVRIITNNMPATGDHHGCPFKHSDGESLKTRLQSLKLSSDAVDQVLDWVKKGHYQVACGEVFKAQHSSSSETHVDFAPNHPNQYFTESRNILTGKPDGVEANVTPSQVIRRPYNRSSQASQESTRNTDELSFMDETDDLILSSAME